MKRFGTSPSLTGGPMGGVMGCPETDGYSFSFGGVAMVDIFLFQQQTRSIFTFSASSPDVNG